MYAYTYEIWKNTQQNDKGRDLVGGERNKTVDRIQRRFSLFRIY